MAKTIATTKTMLLRQARRLADRFVAKFPKAGKNLPKAAVQSVLDHEMEPMLVEMFEVLRRRVEAVSNLIVRKVRVDRTRTNQQALEATGRVQYTDCEVVDAMPKTSADEVEVMFFKPDLSERSGYISDDDLEKEFELRGLKPADPISVAAVNEADTAFADEKPHGTHWKDAKGNWCCAIFGRWRGERKVFVHRYGSAWIDGWWFAGVRK